MNIVFYKFSKKPNSTKIPEGTVDHIVVSCSLKAACSLTSPVITIGKTTAGDGAAALGFNYAYIADFHRYYFVKDWVADGNLWTVYLDEDVLASWKTSIGEESLYIKRSSDLSVWDQYISDAIYPTKAIPTTSNAAITRPWAGSTGCYVIGVTCSPPLGIDFGLQVGSTSYFVVDEATMTAIAKTLMSESWAESEISANIDMSTFKAIFNPLQYIQSIMYYPYTVANNGFGGSFYCGWYKVYDDSSHRVLGVADHLYAFNTTLTLPKHPDASSRGAYLNGAPYTEYVISAPPFGTIALDASKCMGLSSIYLVTTVDQLTGIASLFIYSDSSQGVLLATAHGQVGIPVTLNQIAVDHSAEALNNKSMAYTAINGVIGIAGGAASAASAASVGNYAGAAAGLTDAVQAAMSTDLALDNGIYNGLKLSAGHMSSAGSTGSFLYLAKVWRLDATFHRPVSEDILQYGRPVYATHQIKTLSGYIQVLHGDIACNATDSEKLAIKSILESGFYYE